LWGGFSVDNATLNRFFSIHYTLPFLILGLVFLHLSLLHSVGSNNPLGIDTIEDRIPFTPYYMVKDFFGFGIMFIFFINIILYYPNNLGHPDNYVRANAMITPIHIVPEWYD
jgi:ubiquinol-cytochrome c reductase cytochrome b subunit